MCIGLPDTIWFPRDGLRSLPDGRLSLLLFPVEQPEHFDAVITSDSDEVLEIQVKNKSPRSKWIWGALKMPGPVLFALQQIWLESKDEYLGTLINSYLARGGRATGFKIGKSYVDVGTLNGYREALRVLEQSSVIDRI